MNALYTKIDDQTSTIAAMRDAIEARDTLHKRFVRQNVAMAEAARKLLLAVLCDQSRSRMMPAIDMTAEIDGMRKALEGWSDERKERF